ncbi:MAG: hypothetical protein PHD43_15300 [Methylococcales bacterium]|nr:hypothetical protein [Methylococcales bacterium]
MDRFKCWSKPFSPNSQAEELGIKAGDIFTDYDNKPILGMAAFIYGRSLEPTT